LWRRTGAGVVVLGAAATRPTFVTGPAAEAWDLLMERQTVDELAANLADRHATATDVVRRDLVAVIEAWERDGAVEPTS
jgi:hypothetical protein